MYTPGLAMRVSERYKDALCSHFRHGNALSGRLAETALMLTQAAAQTVAARETLATAAYRPTSLLLYLSNTCNCACAYCFTRPRPHHPAVNEAAARAAIDLVAQNARERRQLLRVHFHGGGEPTLHLELIERLAAYARNRGDFPVEIVLSTNGVLPRGEVPRLARFTDLVRISCDGPPDVQDALRRDCAGEATFAAVAATIDGLHELNVRLAIRATITRASVSRQREIVEFFFDRFSVSEIYFEPVFALPGMPSEPLACDDPESVCGEFPRRTPASRVTRRDAASVRNPTGRGAWAVLRPPL